MYDLNFHNSRIIICGIIILTLFLNEAYIGIPTKDLILSKHSSLKNEKVLAAEINEVIPKESSVYIFTDVRLYYLCHFNPAIPKKFGFAWNHTLTLADLKEILGVAPYVIVNKIWLNKDYPIMDNTLIISPLLDEFGFILISEVEPSLLYSKQKR